MYGIICNNNHAQISSTESDMINVQWMCTKLTSESKLIISILLQIQKCLNQAQNAPKLG